MSRFIETIRLHNGKLEHLDYHQSRVDRAFAEYFKDKVPVDIASFLQTCPMPSVGLHRIRLIYGEEILSVQIITYKPKEIRSLKIVEANSISYSHKFEDRTAIETMLMQKGECDDVVIVKDERITDSSIANLIFKRDGRWYTPASFLLNGTTRQRLLDEKKIEEEEITIHDLPRYESVKMINAMLQFDAPEIDVTRIVR